MKNLFENVQTKPDVRLCNVWIKYTDDKEIDLEAWLDIDSSIEDQIRMSFQPLSIEHPQIADFRWDLVRSNPCNIK